MFPDQHSITARLRLSDFVQPSSKCLRRQFVEVWGVLFKKFLPQLAVPDFGMVVYADQHDFMIQTSILHQSVGNTNTALSVQIDSLCSGVEQSHTKSLTPSEELPAACRAPLAVHRFVRHMFLERR